MDISKIKLGNTTYDIKDIIARTAELSSLLPRRSLPTAKYPQENG